MVEKTHSENNIHIRKQRTDCIHIQDITGKNKEKKKETNKKEKTVAQ